MTNQPTQSYEIAIFNQLVKNSESIAVMNSNLINLEKKVDQNYTELNSKIEILDNKVTTLDNKVTALDNKVDGIDSRLEKIEEGYESIVKTAKFLRTGIVTIGIGVLINIVSTPVLSQIFH